MSTSGNKLYSEYMEKCCVNTIYKMDWEKMIKCVKQMEKEDCK